MYKCQRCGQVSELGEKSHRVVEKTRFKEYVNTIRYKKGIKLKKPLVIESTGSEIVRELLVCKSCIEGKVTVESKVTPRKSSNRRRYWKSNKKFNRSRNNYK